MQALSLEERVSLARMVVGVLDEWGIGAADQVAILSLPDGTPTRTLRRYRDDTPIPDDPAVLERVEHLLGIADALRTTFPTNRRMGAQWMNRPHRRFNQRTPVATLIEGGLSGLQTVRSHLDCAYAWQRTEAAVPR